jgi:hypothetical protein
MIRYLLACLLLCNSIAFAQESLKTDWGSITAQEPTDNGIFSAVVSQPTTTGKLSMPRPFPNIVRCFTSTNGTTTTIPFEFNADATSLTLQPPAGLAVEKMELQTSEKTEQFADGRIILNALDARVNGSGAKLEQHAGNYRIGFWTSTDDTVSWDYNASRWGMYSVLLTYSAAAPNGSEIEINWGETKVTGALVSTGSWYRYNTLEIGKIYIEKAGKQTLTVKCTKKVGGAIMNLKAVCLVPACEGKPPVQAEDGSVLLHGRDATVHGTTLRYEPDPKKITLGFWVKQSDAATWQFEIKQPGTFALEVMQGCGKGAGGSDMQVQVAETSFEFVVEDTGHFQNFKPRQLGLVKIEKPGIYTAKVQPKKIAKNAAMDLQQMQLIPQK